MLTPLFAANWGLLIEVGTIVVVALYWVISAFAKQIQPTPPRRTRPVEAPPSEERVQDRDPLQAEIDEFLRNAQAQREGRPEDPNRSASQPANQPPRRPRPKRRPVSTVNRDTTQRPPPLPSSATPGGIEVGQAERPREPLIAPLAKRSESSVFDQRARQLSQVQLASDSDFQQHMQKVFDHDVGNLKSTMGVFEAAGAAAAAITAQAASDSASEAQSSKAPKTIRKRTSDIALFLAGKKNIRDAVILSEILRRPEDRW
ncbi:MAG: hypothetical protein IT427_03125 [Pirellulales bacterium]|nr:hypothetical protein [Pirellulales bacterium]